MNHKKQITHISITRLGLRPTIRRFIPIHLREINHRGGIFNCSRRALRHRERPRGPGLKGPTVYVGTCVMSSDCNRTPRLKHTRRYQTDNKTSTLRFHPRLIPAPLLGRITAEGILIQSGCSSVGLNLKCVSALGVCVVLYF